MKTILFFDRCDLTDLYILLTKELQGKLNIVHVAYSEIEAKKLDAAGIKDYILYQNELSKCVDEAKLDDELLNIIDNVIIESSGGRFNLNSSIQSDRGFTILSYDEALILAQSHYLVWKSIFDKQKVDLMLHEACSQFMVHIAALLCKKQGGIFRYPIYCFSDKPGYYYINIDGENYDCPEIKERFDYYLNHPEQIDKERITAFLAKFRKDYSVMFGSLISQKASVPKLLLGSIKKRLIQWKYRGHFHKLKNNIDYWMIECNESSKRLDNLNRYKELKIHFETELPEGETYYYYSIHLEPEATVFYLGDGIYANQVKLIENIAAALPPHTYLYVKDHPHEFAYRNADDYERLQRVPNIRLIHQSIPGKKVVAGAKGVFSINGTAGFESLLLGKQVFCFGHTYYDYCSRTNFIKNIRDLRSVMYELKDKTYEDDTELFAFINAYFDASHDGFTSYFGDIVKKVGIDEKENASKIACDIEEELLKG